VADLNTKVMTYEKLGEKAGGIAGMKLDQVVQSLPLIEDNVEVILATVFAEFSPTAIMNFCRV
jgi:hypothetical protein